MSGKGKTVCVTGASGYIASWLIKLLLQCGYTVRATLRDPSDPKKSEHLLVLEGAADRLHLFKADLLEEGSFDTVIDGCDGVFHTASPVVIDVTDVQAELIAPAVNGTLNVLRSCAKSSSVKRVVVTSSMAAVTHNGQELPPDAVVDETMFSTSEFCQQSKLWYYLSKTLAEEAAWKFARDHGIDMVVLHPGFVIGALLQPKLNGSSTVLLSLINGSSTLPNIPLRLIDVIDVKDVAKAHILAYEVPSASGRYCLVERVIPYSEAVEIIQKYYPSRMVADKSSNDISPEPAHEISKDKARSLGLDFTPFEQSIKEAIESFKEKGFLI